jgi:hypothetical protein
MMDGTGLKLDQLREQCKVRAEEGRVGYDGPIYGEGERGGRTLLLCVQIGRPGPKETDFHVKLN